MSNEITLKDFISLLSDFTDGSQKCRYSARGCEEHKWFGFAQAQACPHERAKELLDWQDKQHFRLVIQVHDEI